MKKLVILLSALLFATPAQSADWRLIGYDGEMALYLDVDSITPVNNIDVSKTYLSITTKTQELNVNKKSHMMANYYISCDGNYFTRSIAFWDDKGRLTKSRESPNIATPLNFKYAFPETNIANTIQKACAYHKTKYYSYK